MYEQVTETSPVLRPRLRPEAGRTYTWVRQSIAGRAPRGVAIALATGADNVVAAISPGRGRGRSYCPCCGNRVGAFRSVPGPSGVNRRARCPGCDSAPRHRALAALLPRIVGTDRVGRILHFAPEPQLVPLLRRWWPDADYLTTDLNRTDVDRPGEDIQALGFASGQFDLVICNHVLEHVPDDDRAVSELARITAPGGRAVITVPGDWSRAETVPSDPARNGHHRDYGWRAADWLGERFGRCEVLESPRSIGGVADRPIGVREDEPVFVCSAR